MSISVDKNYAFKDPFEAINQFDNKETFLDVDKDGHLVPLQLGNKKAPEDKTLIWPEESKMRVFDYLNKNSFQEHLESLDVERVKLLAEELHYYNLQTFELTKLLNECLTSPPMSMLVLETNFLWLMDFLPQINDQKFIDIVLPLINPTSNDLTSRICFINALKGMLEKERKYFIRFMLSLTRKEIPTREAVFREIFPDERQNVVKFAQFLMMSNFQTINDIEPVLFVCYLLKIPAPERGKVVLNEIRLLCLYRAIYVRRFCISLVRQYKDPLFDNKETFLHVDKDGYLVPSAVRK